MAIEGPIVRTAVGVQSLALLGRATKVAKKPTLKEMFKGFTDITIGTALLKPTASLANQL